MGRDGDRDGPRVGLVPRSRPERLRHLLAAHYLGDDHLVGARPSRQRFVHLVAYSNDEVDGRRDLAGQNHDLDVRVRAVDGRHDGARPFDPRLPERRLAACVALYHQRAAVAGAFVPPRRPARSRRRSSRARGVGPRRNVARAPRAASEDVAFTILRWLARRRDVGEAEHEPGRTTEPRAAAVIATVIGTHGTGERRTVRLSAVWRAVRDPARAEGPRDGPSGRGRRRTAVTDVVPSQRDRRDGWVVPVRRSGRSGLRTRERSRSRGRGTRSSRWSRDRSTRRAGRSPRASSRAGATDRPGGPPSRPPGRAR